MLVYRSPAIPATHCAYKRRDGQAELTTTTTTTTTTATITAAAAVVDDDAHAPERSS